MAYIGKIPAAAALTAGDIADGIISADKLATNAVTQVKVADDAIALAELKAGTDGEIISWDASGNPVAIGAGSSGEFLKSQGAGSVPVFAAAGGGGFVHLKTTTISSGTATVDFNHGSGGVIFDSTYNAYLFVFSDIHGATDAQPFELTFSTDAGSSYISSAYAYAHKGNRSGTSSLGHNSASDSNIDCTSLIIGGAAIESLSMQLWFHKPFGTDGAKMVSIQSAQMDNDGNYAATVSMGSNSATTAITGIRFKFGSGNIDRGLFSMFGVKNS